jgi:hypothetical protein
MRTPAGKECKYYYEDYFRGRSVQTCRLIENNPDSPPWKPGLCQNCPVPQILLSNACPNMKLQGRVEKRFLGFVEGVHVEGWCSATFKEVTQFEVGCGHCMEYRDKTDGE